MVENINDFLSVAFVVGILFVGLFIVFRQFSIRHQSRIKNLEKEYYIQDFEEDDSE